MVLIAVFFLHFKTSLPRLLVYKNAANPFCCSRNVSWNKQPFADVSFLGELNL